MKVLFVTAAYPPMKAGEADHAYHQCMELAKRGLDVHVLTTESNTWTHEVPFTVHPIMRDWSWSDLPRFARFVKRCAPDHVILYYIGWAINFGLIFVATRAPFDAFDVEIWVNCVSNRNRKSGIRACILEADDVLNVLILPDGFCRTCTAARCIGSRTGDVARWRT